MADDDPLTPRQARALAELLAGGSVASAARASGVSVRTLGRWRADPAFAAAHRCAARARSEQAVSDLLAAQGEAVDTLRRCLRNPAPTVRVRAARALLELGIKAQADDVATRLDRLEELWQEHAPGSTLWSGSPHHGDPKAAS